MAAITGSVGRSGINKPQDVRTVQTLLNQHRPIPLRAIGVDGVSGLETITAIEEFQRRVVKFQTPDGRVDPGGKTWKALTGGAPVAKAPTSQRAMADLMFITETGLFHSACRCSWGNVVEWYGFKPREHLSPKGPGMVDRSDRSALIKHYVKFDVHDAILRAAVQKVADDYGAKTYVVGVCDCVSFTADVARQSRLRVPAGNITPYGFIEVLAFWNKYKEKQ